MEHLEGLNEKQREAAVHSEGPLLVIAGAGAGKTKTITHRIINLIKEGVEPQNILAVTFTNKAAKEMRERIEKEIEKNAKGGYGLPYVATFHSLGVYIIKENARLLGLTRHFTILDEGDSVAMIKETMRELGFDPKIHDPKKIKNIISRQKGEFVESADYQGAQSEMGRIIAQIWPRYEERKSKENSLDFDDLLLKSAKLLENYHEIKEKYQNQWKYIHIDEYQDTNEVQYKMACLLSESHKNICVVGDADQNIYSWRGANLRNILNFEKDFLGAKVVMLEQNYRSTQNILLAANEVIKKNKFRPEKNLFTKNMIGDKISVYEALEEIDESEFVVTKILDIWDHQRESTVLRSVGRSDGDGHRKFPVGNFRADQTSTLSEVAILYRANFQSRVLEEAMLRYNIPYQVLGVRFFERKEIKDTLAYLRAALNPGSLGDIKRIINFPTRGIGKVTLLKIFAGEKETLPIKVRMRVENFYKTLEEIREKINTSKPSEVVKFAVKRSGIEDELKTGNEEELERLENIKELATLALKYDPPTPDQSGGRAGNMPNGLGVERLLEDAALASDQDSIINTEQKKEKRNSVKLMTVHAAKGLEFKYVFITGLEDGLFPHERNGGDKEDQEEERRLFYVALTRAKEKLFLSFANYRTIFGSRQINTPSEFLGDIPPEILERADENGSIKTIYI